MTTTNEYKHVMRGAHRAVPPEGTWARIKPLFSRMGITRVADMTGLDVVGLPVYQAVRPNARTLSVSQGKGITHELSRVSAAMECIELWHAEELPLAFEATVDEMASTLPYSVFDLVRPTRSALSGKSRLHWMPAARIGGGESVWIPQESVRLGVEPTSPGQGPLPVLHRSSNGLASGNTVEEAVLHAMYEVIERDALARSVKKVMAGPYLDLSTVSGTPKCVLDHFVMAAVDVRVRDLSPLAGMPCYEAEVWSHSLPIRHAGAGCHLDPEVALTRALTEAAQARVAMIAGTRDDLGFEAYTWVTSRANLRSPISSSTPMVEFPMDSFNGRVSDFSADLSIVSQIMQKHCTAGIYWVNLTRREFDVPVVKVIAPGMREIMH